MVTVRRNGGPIRANLNDVQPADMLLIAPGERIAVDGRVTSGHSYVDQSSSTGESSPVRKQTSSFVYAGTVNHAGALDVVAERLGKDTSFGKIVEAVERAEHSLTSPRKTTTGHN
jgi:P-type E1-E2 ATPase